MNANKYEFDLTEGEEGEAYNKPISTFTQGIDNLTKRINQIADRLFYWFVIFCGLVLLVVWLTTNS